MNVIINCYGLFGDHLYYQDQLRWVRLNPSRYSSRGDAVRLATAWRVPLLVLEPSTSGAARFPAEWVSDKGQDERDACARSFVEHLIPTLASSVIFMWKAAPEPTAPPITAPSPTALFVLLDGRMFWCTAKRTHSVVGIGIVENDEAALRATAGGAVAKLTLVFGGPHQTYEGHHLRMLRGSDVYQERVREFVYWLSQKEPALFAQRRPFEPEKQEEEIVVRCAFCEQQSTIGVPLTRNAGPGPTIPVCEPHLLTGEMYTHRLNGGGMVDGPEARAKMLRYMADFYAWAKREEAKQVGFRTEPDRVPRGLSLEQQAAKARPAIETPATAGMTPDYEWP